MSSASKNLGGEILTGKEMVMEMVMAIGDGDEDRDGRWWRGDRMWGTGIEVGDGGLCDGNTNGEPITSGVPQKLSIS